MARLRLALALTALALLAPAAPAFANTYCVLPDDSCASPYPQSAAGVQSALGAAQSHAGADTVRLGAATYTAAAGSGFHYAAGSGNGLTVVGAGADQTVLSEATTSSTAAVFEVTGSGGEVDVQDLGLVGNGIGFHAHAAGGTSTIHRATISAQSGVVADASTATVDDSLIELTAGTAPTALVAQASSSGAASLTAKQVTVIGSTGSTGASSRGATSGSNAASLHLSESIVRGASTLLARVPGSGGASVSASYDDYDPSGVNVGATGGSGSFSDTHRRTDDPVFVDAAGGDYRLRYDSPLIDAGNPADALAAGESATDRDGRPRIVDGDGDGTAVRDLGAYEYVPAAPTASATVTPARQFQGARVTFDGAGSDPNPGEALTYSWSFDDGGTATGQSVEYAFADPGPHVATLTVTDPTGRSATAEATVDVVPGPLRVYAGVHIAARTLRVSRRRVARVRVSCPATAFELCSGRLRLTSGSLHGRKLGSAGLQVPVGAARTVKVTLTKAAMRRVLRVRRLKAIAAATTHDSRHVNVRTHATEHLRPPARRR